MAVDTTTKRTGGNTNTNEISDRPAGVTLNSSTYTKIADADDNRVFFYVDNMDALKACFIRLAPATDAIDTTNKGIFLNEQAKGDSSFEMTAGAMYTGEVSGISFDGNPMVAVTQF